MSIRLVIGFCGLIGSGKTTAATALINSDMCFARIAFAGPLKRMLGTIGLDLRHLNGDLKEQPCDLLCGATPRHAMQTLGTEWGRRLIGPDFWVRLWEQDVHRWGKTVNVVADDVRFEGEMEAIRRMGGKVVFITRHGVARQDHESERFAFVPDAIVRNEGTIEEFQARIIALVRS